MVFWLIVVIIVVALIIWRFYLKPYSYWKSMKVPQTFPWFLLGDTWPTIFRTKNLIEWMSWIYNMYPENKFTGGYQFYLPTLMIKDPETIKQITIKDFDHFTDHCGFAIPAEVDILMGRNLFSLKGERWREMRSLLSGSFTSGKIKIMYNLISDESKKYVNYFKIQEENLIEVELKDIFTRYTNDVIATTSFGITVNSLEDPNNDFFKLGLVISKFSGVKVLLKFLASIVCPWIFKVLNIGFFPKHITKYFQQIIYETIKMREEKKIIRPDMINLLMEVKNNGLKSNVEENPNADADSELLITVKDDEEEVQNNETWKFKNYYKKQIEITNLDIAAQAMIFFIAGFHSVATMICFTCYELAVNLDIQQILRREIEEVVGKTNGDPNYEDLLGMPYLDMVVSEALRKWPVAPATDRVCVKPYTLLPQEPEDPTISLKIGDVIWIPTYNIHHDPKYYHDPEKFIPERFSQENKQKIDSATYMPFGIGPRLCIGSRFALLEIKSMIFHLLNSFEVVVTDKTPNPLPISKNSIAFEIEGGFPLAFKRI